MPRDDSYSSRQQDVVGLLVELAELHDRHQLGAIEVLTLQSAHGRWIRVEVDANGRVDWKVRR